MKRTAIMIAAPLIAVVATIAIQKTLRARQAFVPPPNAAEPVVEAKQAETVETSASPEHSAPITPRTDTISLQQSETASSSPEAVNGSASAQLRQIDEAIETSYSSTIAAFALHGEEADYEKHDAQAQQDAQRLQQLLSAMRADLSPELTNSCDAIVDRIAAAQLQLMAFAINRKNRGLPDSVQVEAELADRKAFQDDTQPLFDRVKAALSSVGTGT